MIWSNLAQELGFEGLEVLLFIITFLLIIYVLANLTTVVGKGLLLQKAGTGFWKALIPLYNDFVLCRVTGTNVLWFALNIITFILMSVEGELILLWFVTSVIYKCVLAASVSKSFNKSIWSTIGLILLPNIFYLIVGITAEEYLGPKGCNDPILGKVSFGNTVSNTPVYNQTIPNEETEVYRFCYKCGYVLSEHDKFCSGCGQEL